jgi:hypothetical protein
VHRGGLVEDPQPDHLKPDDGAIMSEALFILATVDAGKSGRLRRA